MVDASGQTAWCYDPFGHIVIERRTIGTTTENTTYIYNVDGSAASVTYPSGRVITYTYNNAQQVVSVIDTTSSTKYITGAVYTPHGKLSSAVHGLVSGGFAGITESYTYNNRLQTTAHTASSTSGTVVNDAYSHDLGGGMNNGSIAVITNNLDVGRTQTFTYDNLNRLSTAQSQATSGVNCWGNSYGYDRFGNLLAMNVTKCTAPNLNVTVNNNNQIIGMTYDAAGNLTNDGSWTDSWDGENRLKSAAGVNYTWDGTNMRRKREPPTCIGLRLPAATISYLDAAPLPACIIDEFVYFNGQQVGYRDNVAGQVYHYLNDNRGSAKVMASSTGVTKFESDDYPQGAARIITSTKDSLLKFQGKQQDTESGLLSVPHMYSPNLARVLSPVASQVTKRSTLLPQALNKMNATAGRPMATFAAFIPENCQQCQTGCTNDWAVCIGRNFPAVWVACQAALGACYAKCEAVFGPSCSILPPPAPKKPRKPSKPSPGTPATPGAPAPWWPSGARSF